MTGNVFLKAVGAETMKLAGVDPVLWRGSCDASYRGRGKFVRRSGHLL